MKKFQSLILFSIFLVIAIAFQFPCFGTSATTAPVAKPNPFAALKPGQVIDLGGQSIALQSYMKIPVGAAVTVRNGTISFSGGKGETGDPSMAVFEVSTGAAINASRLHIVIPSNHAVLRTDGGSAHLTDVDQTAGALLWGCGFDNVTIDGDCYSTGIPDKYYIFNGTMLGKTLRADFTGSNHWILQGKNEAAVRLMQVNDSIIIGARGHGSGVKQCFQDRPGGAKGSVYKQHIWKNCVVMGGVDLGNFNDETDTNYPFGILQLSEWDNCSIDWFHKTYNAAGAFGIQKFAN